MMNESLPISCISALHIYTLYLFSPVASPWLQMVWQYSLGGGGRQKAPPPPPSHALKLWLSGARFERCMAPWQTLLCLQISLPLRNQGM